VKKLRFTVRSSGNDEGGSAAEEALGADEVKLNSDDDELDDPGLDDQGLDDERPDDGKPEEEMLRRGVMLVRKVFGEKKRRRAPLKARSGSM
jgi:hypothetical protein